VTLWKSKISKEILDVFRTADESLLKIRIVSEIWKTLTDLLLSLGNYFSEFGVNDCKWVIKSIRKKTKLPICLPKKNNSLIYETTISINQPLLKIAWLNFGCSQTNLIQ